MPDEPIVPAVELPVPEVPKEVVAAVDIPVTAAETKEVEASGVFWLLVLGGLLFVVLGWFLPWFVEPTSGGIGFSPQDVVSSAPTGIGTVFAYIIGVAMLGLIAGVAYDAVGTRTRRWAALRHERIRAIAAAAGAASTIMIWILIGLNREEPLFGNITPFAQTDNAVWMTLTGFTICALAYGLRPWIVAHTSVALGGVAFVIGGLVPFMFNQSTEFISWAAGSAAIYTLLALGLNVVVGFAGLLDLGYAAFFAIGAYTAGSMASSRHGLHLPFWVILFLGMAVAAWFGALLGAPTLRLRGDYLAIVTLGFGEIIPDAANNNLFHQTGGPNGITGIDHPTIPFTSFNFGIEPRYYFWALLILIALVVVCLRNLERSRLGRAWVAIREDEVAAAATGINTVSSKLLAFAIGAAVSGFAGAFYGAQLGVVTPEDFRFTVSVTALSTVVLGGIGNITGVAVGAIIISFIIFWILPHMSEWMTTFGTTTNITQFSTIQYSNYVYIVYGVILVLIMLVRPAGLLPSRARKVELQTGAESEPLAAVRGQV